jgi:endonuclease YncB( thermonuclease family)
MRSRNSLTSWRFTLIALVIAGAIALAQWKGWLPRDGHAVGTEHSSLRKIGAWEELRGCTLAEDRANDGDSFEVRHGGQRHVMRLYFVDCPEKTRHQYNGPRIAEQGRYFGGLTEEETVGIGERARDFSLELLGSGAFTILTRWEKVFDSERCYAFVAVPRGDLGELLVAEGLARIFTKGENRPGGEPAAAAKKRLQHLEVQAKSAGRGAWRR